MADIKFYMDEHVPPAVTNGLRLRGVDATTTPETGMLGSSDEALLNYPFSLERVPLSQDQDFLILHQQGFPHAGIAYAAQKTSIRDMVRGLLLIHDLLTAEEMRGRVEFLTVSNGRLETLATASSPSSSPSWCSGSTPRVAPGWPRCAR